jgi:hypothetical protein
MAPVSVSSTPAASGLHVFLGVASGLLLYTITAVVSSVGSFIFGLGVIPILSREFNPIPWGILILLSNILPVIWFFGCRHKKRFFAFGLLGGSCAGCVLYLIFMVSAFQEAAATAPQPG